MKKNFVSVLCAVLLLCIFVSALADAATEINYAITLGDDSEGTVQVSYSAVRTDSRGYDHIEEALYLSIWDSGNNCILECEPFQDEWTLDWFQESAYHDWRLRVATPMPDILYVEFVSVAESSRAEYLVYRWDGHTYVPERHIEKTMNPDADELYEDGDCIFSSVYAASLKYPTIIDALSGELGGYGPNYTELASELVPATVVVDLTDDDFMDVRPLDLSHVNAAPADDSPAKEASLLTLANGAIIKQSSYTNDADGFEAFDGQTDTAWNVGDYGMGEWVSITGAETYQASGFTVCNGCNKTTDDGDCWKNNCRVSQLSVYCDGKFVETFWLHDTRDLQVCVFTTPVIGSSFSFVIEDVYYGDQYSDVCISEIAFY